MTWSIHRVSLASHDLAKAATFFGVQVGLGEPVRRDDNGLAFGGRSRGLHVRRQSAYLARTSGGLAGSIGARHVAIEVGDLQQIAARLDRSSHAYVEAPAGEFDRPALYTLDPALNLVAFCQCDAGGAGGDVIQPWEATWGWGIHHVNLQACDVREATAFYVEIAGMAEGRWRAPAAMGNFSIDPKELSILPLGEFNRGLHIIRPDPGFAHRNNFPHNPSIGGHPAIFVASVAAAKARLEAAGVLVSDAGLYAMVGMYQLYCLDPSANMIEVNQFV